MWIASTIRSPSLFEKSAASRREPSLTRRVEFVREISADPSVLLEAIHQVVPHGDTSSAGTYEWTEPSKLGSDATLQMSASFAPSAAGSRLSITCSYEPVFPNFEWVFDLLVRRLMRSALAHRSEIVEAAAAGHALPAEPKRAWWSPPEAMTSNQIREIATLCLILVIVQYGGSLLTQTLDFVAKTFDATNAELSLLIAATQVGTVVALAGAVLADRVGRRRVLLWSLVFVSVGTTLSAAAPTLWSFGVLQVLVQGGVSLAAAVAFIAAVEEAPEASRTYTLAIVAIASRVGFAASGVVLPIADFAPNAWRWIFVLACVGLIFVPSVSRNLGETKRFAALVSRGAERGRLSEVIDKLYGGRFIVLFLTSFLVSFFVVPETQFLNRYLGDERGFTGLGVLVLRTITQLLPGLGLAFIGGRLAESSGRRPVATWGLLVGACATAILFTSGGPLLWLSLAFATGGIALAHPSLAAFATELFPTEIRGTAVAGLTVAAIVGGVVGLLTVGYLAEPLDSVGRAIAVTAAAPVLVALFLIRRLPEARGKLLDDVSPSEV